MIRISPNGNKKLTIDLTSINALNSEIFFIQNNDYINIKALRQKSLTEGLKPITGIVFFNIIINYYSINLKRVIVIWIQILNKVLVMEISKIL